MVVITMAEYIKREDVLQHKRNMIGADFYGGDSYDEAVLCEDIKHIPAADVEEVRHGEWIDLGDGEWKCSLCGGEIVADAYGDIHPLHDCGWIGCPYCRAKMDGKVKQDALV